MLELVRKINLFFKTANRAEVDAVLSKIILSERQTKIFDMYYIKKHDICFIADSLNVCPLVVSKELRMIREKLIRII